jgi:hypothetical protein
MAAVADILAASVVATEHDPPDGPARNALIALRSARFFNGAGTAKPPALGLQAAARSSPGAVSGRIDKRTRWRRRRRAGPASRKCPATKVDRTPYGRFRGPDNRGTVSVKPVHPRAASVAQVTGFDAESAVLDRVRAELLAREPIFHKPEFGTRLEDYLAMTADDYWEVGASGRIYDRDGVVRGLVARGKVPGDEDWIVSDVRVRRLSHDTYAITYQLDQAGRMTRRLTLWRKDPDGWKILYHQGTLIQDSPAG